VGELDDDDGTDDTEDDDSDEDEDDQEEAEEGDSADEDEEDAGKQLKNNLSNLPLGLLAKAQKTLQESGSEQESEEEDDSLPEEGGATANGFKKKDRKEIQHRSNKHAPTEKSAKRPVSRLRPIVTPALPQPRDPRFTALAGALSLPHVRANYAFLSPLQAGEVQSLKEALRVARRRLPSTPREQREEAELEVQRLAAALKRAESVHEASTREAHESSVLRAVKKKEMAARAEGKGEWHMKRGERKTLLLEARFERLREEGGPRAVQKALRRREKKEGEREKRSRPFKRGEGASE
ncbi:DUF947-domain-containing protein, partial [Calocera viscosa TUFC12733]